MSPPTSSTWPPSLTDSGPSNPPPGWRYKELITGGFKRKSAIDALIQALADKDPQVRAQCIESLDLLSGHSILQRPKESITDYQKRWLRWWKKNSNRYP